MPRTRQQLEQAAKDAESWLDSLDPESTPAEHPKDLQRIGLAVNAAAAAARELDEAVLDARDLGRSWGEIAMVLGVSRQAARQKYERMAHA